MIKGIQNISFNGIYDFVYPKNTPKKVIESKVKETRTALNEKFKNIDAVGIHLEAMDYGMRLMTSSDNPSMMVYIFKQIGGESLAKKYIAKNIQEYQINIQV